MKAEINVIKQVEIKTLLVKAGVRYWEDAQVNGVEDTEGTFIPHRNGDLWEVEIDVDEGRVLNWPSDTTAKIHYKVCDDGDYYLKDDEGTIVLEIEDNYVPSILCPTESGYGDYIILNIDAEGKNEGWKADISDFTDEADD